MDDIRDKQWHLGYLNVDDSHRISEGSGTTVALIDTGIQSNHPDLQASVLPGVDIPNGGKGNGLGDSDGHGTAMAGLIAGHGHGSGSGVLGIAPKAKVVSVRISTTANNGTALDLARAIDWTTERGIRIICIASTGGSALELLDAVRRAQQADVVVVAAAGNVPEDTGVGTPASYPGVIATAATDRHGAHYKNSVVGSEVVISAPGVEIVSTAVGSDYSTGSGTSDAAAIVAGAVALVRSKYPQLSAPEVIHRLTATAIDKGPPGRDEEYGYGVLNLVGALTADVPPLNPTPGNGTAPTRQTAGPSGQAATPGSAGGGGTAWLVGLFGVVLVLVTALLLVARRRSAGRLR